MPIDSNHPKCNALSGRGKAEKRCQLPAGFGVEGSFGHGPCIHHSKIAEVTAGDDVVETSMQHARRMQPSKEHFRYEMEGDSRLAVIMRDMGAEMLVDRSKTGVAHLDLDFEMKAMRAMLIIFMERYQEREDALLAWAQAYERQEVGSAPPKNLLSVEQGHKAVIGIAQVAKVMHDIQQSVPKAEFMSLLTDMADAVIGVIDTLGLDVKDAKKAKRRVQKQWMQLCGKYVV